jgi:hypothetical protein
MMPVGGKRFGSGAPKGNKNAAKDQWFRKALIDEMGATPEERHAMLRKIAARVLDAALNGDMEKTGLRAINELWDRLDGKPKQQVEISGDLTVTDIPDAELDQRIAELIGKAGPAATVAGTATTH